MSSNSNSLNFANRCEFSLIVDDVVSEIPISEVSFILFDSIYNLYPKATMKLNDTNGIYNEFMGFVNGTKIEIDYGLNKESWKKCKYRVIQNSMPEQNNSSTWGGRLNLSLIHDYSYYQSKSSNCYNSNISDIIKSLVKKYPFESTNIDTTLNSGVWYQPYVSDAELIMNYLLPFCYSTESEKSPFFCYIDSNNNFNLKNYNRLVLQNPKQSFYYKSKGILTGTKLNTINTVSFAQVSVSDSREFYNRVFSNYDEYGNFDKKAPNSKITDYPKNDKNGIAIKVNLDNVTSVVSLYDYDVLDEETKNNNLGYEINGVKNGIFTDKIIVNIPFNREICCGDVVELNLPSPTNSADTTELSLRYSGNYVVEATYQKWDGRNSSTTIVCSKQIVKLTSDYRNLALILNR